MYLPSSDQGAFRQGEVLSNVTRLRISLESVGAGEEEPVGIAGYVHPYAVVMTQDCDLAWELDARGDQGESPDGEWATQTDTQLLTEILMCPAQVASQVTPWPRGRRFHEYAQQNRDMRYQFLPPVPAEADMEGVGLAEELVLDFKQLFSMPPAELYRRVALPDEHAQRIKRRWFLDTPYRDHLCSRFLAFHGRIALPEAMSGRQLTEEAAGN